MLNCRKCKQYSRCIKLCDKAKAFVDEIEVKRKEPFIPLGYSSSIDYKDEMYKVSKIVDRIGKLTPKHRAILGAWKAGTSMQDIAQGFGLTRMGVWKIIKYYEEVLK